MAAQRPVSMVKHTAAARLLGLSPLPSAAMAKEAFRRHAKQHHPDVASAAGSKSEAEEKFMKIRAAYETLLRPTMSETAQKLTTPDGQSSKDEVRRYAASTSSGPIKVMTAVLLAMTGWLAFKLHKKERFPHQRGYAIRDLWKDRKLR